MAKYLKEKTGFLRDHKIKYISEDLIASVIVLREGIDDGYDISVNSKDNDTAIEYLVTLEQYKDFEICEK